MSYISKEWKDMVVQYPTRYKIIHADQSQEVVTMVNDFGTVTQEGDVFDAQTFNEFEGRINDAVISTIFGTLDPTSDVGKNGDIYLKTSSGSITAVYAKTDNTWLALPTGGGGGATVYVGTTDPTSDIGENGNLYAKYHTDVTPVVDAFFVKISGSWASVSTGGGGGLVGLELTQSQYDSLTPEEKMNGTVYFITDTSVPSVLDDYQTKEDDSLETTSQEVVGAINELNGLIANKQNSSDNSLTTTVKTVVGAINQLNSYKVAAVNLPSVQGNNYTTLMANLLNFYENSIGAQEVRFVRFVPSYYDSYFKGFAQVAICYKNGNNAYHTYLPTVGMSSYYYDSNWHWQQESRTNVTPS